MCRYVHIVLFSVCTMAAVHAGDAIADPKFSEKTGYYPVKGKDGYQLMEQMNRRGPKHGWWARSIAQTQYTTSWGAAWEYSNGYCRVTDAPVSLSITYVFPKLASNAPASLQKRWRRFFTEVKEHEEHHGLLARKMARAMEKKALSIRIKGDRLCTRMESTLKAQVNAVMKAYEDEQREFDSREHKDGGNVDRMVARLVGE